MPKKKFYWFLTALLVIGVLVILNYNEGNVKISPSYQSSTMQQLHLTHKEDNTVKWELSAKSAIFPIGNKEVFLESLGLKINHSPEIYLTSGSGIYKIEKGYFILKKPVELNIKDAKFITNSLKWNSKNELITTDDAIKFIGKTFLIEGRGLSAKTKQQEVRILNNVEAIFYR